MKEALSLKELKLFTFLRHRMGQDVDISKLHDHLYYTSVQPRLAQQRVGAIVSRVNRKIGDHHIKTGTARHSYVMNVVR